MAFIRIVVYDVPLGLVPDMDAALDRDGLQEGRLARPVLSDEEGDGGTEDELVCAPQGRDVEGVVPVGWVVLTVELDSIDVHDCSSFASNRRTQALLQPTYRCCAEAPDIKQRASAQRTRAGERSWCHLC